MKRLKMSALLLIASATLLTAQTRTNAMKDGKERLWEAKSSGHRYMVSIKNKADAVEALTDFAETHNITAGSVMGIGATNDVIIRFIDPLTNTQEDKRFKEQMEVTSVLGNISIREGKTFVHMHITLGRRDYSVIAGHLVSLRIHGAGEFIIEDFNMKAERALDPEMGLQLLNFSKLPCE